MANSIWQMVGHRPSAMKALPSFLQNQDLRFIFFGGKGGVGKTTSATASALYLARQRREGKVLIVSTDPAHSVGDSFAQAVGDEIVPIEGADNLWARELDAGKVLAEYGHLNNPILAEIANRGTLFDEKDIADFLQLTLPGMDEVMAIREIIALIKGGEYDLVVVDTAPTGHTVRMLQLPSQMRHWVKTLDMMMDRHRYVVRTFAGRYIPDECDRFLEEQRQDVAVVERTLKDAKTTEFVLVTIPEEMAIYESWRLFSILCQEGIPVRNLIVNRVIGGDGLCAPCQRKTVEQAEALAEIEERFADDRSAEASTEAQPEGRSRRSLHLWPVPLLPHEVRGVEELTDFVQLIAGATEEDKETRRPHPLAPSPRLPLALPSASLILVGGKGGVGKTSVAAATAIRLASRHPDERVLLFSTNPAHSVSDSLAQKVGAEIARIEDTGNNLYAQEIDAPRLLDRFIAEQREAIDEVFRRIVGGGNVRVAFEREIMDQMLSTTPPGLDELMAMMEIMKLVDAGAFDIFVLDGAATGHLLRFLEVPHLARQWFITSARLLLKYRGVVPLGATAELTIRYSRQTRRVLEQLANAAETEFIVVTIPEAMGIAESERLIQGLDRLNIPCRQILINFVIPPSDCLYCEAKREEEQRYIQQVIAEHPDHHVAQAPRLDHELRGMDDLVEFGEILYGDQETRFSRKNLVSE